MGYLDTHPGVAVAVTLLAGWLAPTPRSCRQWVTVFWGFSKGLIMQLNANELETSIKDAQKLVRLALAYVPGSTPEEKTRHITDEVQPLFAAAIAPLALPGMVNDFAGKLLGWMIAAEVNAAEATA